MPGENNVGRSERGGPKKSRGKRGRGVDSTWIVDADCGLRMWTVWCSMMDGDLCGAGRSIRARRGSTRRRWSDDVWWSQSESTTMSSPEPVPVSASASASASDSDSDSDSVKCRSRSPTADRIVEDRASNAVDRQSSTAVANCRTDFARPLLLLRSSLFALHSPLFAGDS